ncbi:hypothetical protein SLEP1_g4259 [Rubroshorea leprosula]|uniref:RanBP2-type domain-containing protein n=1 Tax=Rubroshorea leprosula TaxID=152421 RepID=A0AAV5HN54_9ROSI|nr:hypothetical protein SLEP1_g4259 [Rubroshorea leprosula]
MLLRSAQVSHTGRGDSEQTCSFTFSDEAKRETATATNAEKVNGGEIGCQYEWPGYDTVGWWKPGAWKCRCSGKGTNFFRCGICLKQPAATTTTYPSTTDTESASDERTSPELSASQLNRVYRFPSN